MKANRVGCLPYHTGYVAPGQGGCASKVHEELCSFGIMNRRLRIQFLALTIYIFKRFSAKMLLGVKNVPRKGRRVYRCQLQHRLANGTAALTVQYYEARIEA